MLDKFEVTVQVCLCIQTLVSVLSCLPQFVSLSAYVEPSGRRHTNTIHPQPPHLVSRLECQKMGMSSSEGFGAAVRSVRKSGEFPRLWHKLRRVPVHFLLPTTITSSIERSNFSIYRYGSATPSPSYAHNDAWYARYVRELVLSARKWPYRWPANQPWLPQRWSSRQQTFLSLFNSHSVCISSIYLTILRPKIRCYYNFLHWHTLSAH